MLLQPHWRQSLWVFQLLHQAISQLCQCRYSRQYSLPWRRHQSATWLRRPSEYPNLHVLIIVTAQFLACYSWVCPYGILLAGMPTLLPFLDRVPLCRRQASCSCGASPFHEKTTSKSSCQHSHVSCGLSSPKGTWDGTAVPSVSSGCMGYLRPAGHQFC